MLNIETPPVKRNLQYKIYWQNVKDRTLKFYQPHKGDYYSSIQLLRIIEFLAVNKHDSGLLLFSRILKLTIHGTVICQTFPCINVSELISLFMLLTVDGKDMYIWQEEAQRDIVDNSVSTSYIL